MTLEEPAVTSDSKGVPDWDLEQLEIILEDPASWQLVVAGPGTGKSAVACQRVASLVDDGVLSSRILLVSFTRTAVAEIRDRIVSYAVAGDLARTVRISTIDSHAWSLRSGFDDEPLPRTFGDESHDLSIARVVELFRARNPDLLDFMDRLEHLLIDEAQDVMGVRADLAIEMLRSLSPTCGVTILADPAQAIYGFTTEEGETEAGSASLLARLESESPRKFTSRWLKETYRIQDARLEEVFSTTRQAVEEALDPSGYVDRILQLIRQTGHKSLGKTTYERIAETLAQVDDDGLLLLFRRRADVLFASSFCSKLGVVHRIRMSGVPITIRPWIGWIFGEMQTPFVTRDEFNELWSQRAALAPGPFYGETPDSGWDIIHRLAAGSRDGVIDLVQLRRALSRSRPPVEVCLPDLGTRGPIIGTIHASKGREADNVLLVLPPSYGSGKSDTADTAFEEGRVYYVGATRARRILMAADSSGSYVSYLDSRRIYRDLHGNRAQLEFGRDGDVDRLAHLSWTNSAEVQWVLASCTGTTLPIQATLTPEHGYELRLVLKYETGALTSRLIEIGQMSESFRSDWGKLWSKMDPGRALKPPDYVPHLYLIGAATVALSDDELSAVVPPFSKSGFALVPIIKGFPVVQFLYRRRRG